MTTLQWARLSSDGFNVALFSFIAGMVAYFAHLAFRATPIWIVARAIAIAGAGASVVSITARGMAAQRIPWGNMYEFSTLLALLVVVAYLVLVEGLSKIRTLGGFVLMFAVLTMAIAVSFFDVAPGPLVPALNSYWRQIHVTAMISASSLLGLGCIVSILFLFKDATERRRAARSLIPPPIMGGALDLDAAPPHFEAGADEPAGGSGTRSGVLPPAATLDRLAYRIIAFGFPIWTFGVIAGAVWAQSAWGRYWGWDPKETWSFITWVIFAGYLHARATSGWKGRRAAVIACVGFVSLFVTYYAVNLWIAGLHSYAT
ncbi:MAG: c-type cytochrome biogenesis protein CcsB [Actinomycetota bacterium]|nr:c-type cytochrome biogenesis protein CcsB [Actinomycetota bacterium]